MLVSIFIKFRFYQSILFGQPGSCNRLFSEVRICYYGTQVSCQHTGVRVHPNQQVEMQKLSAGTVIMEHHADGPPGVDNKDASLCHHLRSGAALSWKCLQVMRRSPTQKGGLFLRLERNPQLIGVGDRMITKVLAFSSWGLISEDVGVATCDWTTPGTNTARLVSFFCTFNIQQHSLRRSRRVFISPLPGYKTRKQKQ